MTTNFIRGLAGGIVALALLASSAWADLKVVSEMTIKGMPEAARAQLSAPSDKPTTITTYYKGDLVRVEQGDIITITDYKAGTVLNLNPKAKTYYVTKIGEMMDAMANNPMMAMFKMDVKADVTPGTDEKTIAGRKAKNYKYTATIKMSLDESKGDNNLPVPPNFAEMLPTVHIKGENWVTDEIKVPTTSANLGRTVGPMMAMFGKGMKDFQAKMASIPGFPLLTNTITEIIMSPAALATIPDGQAPTPITVTTEVKSITEGPLEDALFTPPADYKKVDPPQPGGAGAGAGGGGAVPPGRRGGSPQPKNP